MTNEIGINQLKRRDFLKAGLVFGAGAAGLAAGYAAVPDAFARAVYAAKREGVTNDNILVMIQLAGGNDGLRTVVPLADPALHDLRPKLSGSIVSQALPLNNQYGFNHNLGAVKALWDQGKVAIVQGVGYPNPTFSHFESIRIWETGDPTRRQVDGWLGRTLATSYDSNGHPLTGCACGTTDVPGALRDLQATMTVIQNQKTFGFTGGSEVEAAVRHRDRDGDRNDGDASNFICQLSADGRLQRQGEARLLVEEPAGRRPSAGCGAHRHRDRREAAARHAGRLRHPLHRAQPPRRPDGLPRLGSRRFLQRPGGPRHGEQSSHRHVVRVRPAAQA